MKIKIELSSGKIIELTKDEAAEMLGFLKGNEGYTPYVVPYYPMPEYPVPYYPSSPWHEPYTYI